jgi:hypothetical protein
VESRAPQGVGPSSVDDHASDLSPAGVDAWQHYFTSIQANGYKIALVGAHLLAFPTDSTRCSEREAQATVLRGIIDQYLDAG